MKTSLTNAKTRIDDVQNSLGTMEENIKADLDGLESLIKTNGEDESRRTRS